MHAFFEAFLDRYQDMYGEFKKAIAGLPQEALDWVPGEDMNSLVVLIVHVTGVTRYLVGDVALGEISNRDRAAEFSAKGLSEAELVARLDDSLSYLQGALERLSLDDLATSRPAPGRNYELTTAWALLHALEEVSLHVGHAQLTRQLWDQRK